MPKFWTIDKIKTETSIFYTVETYYDTLTDVKDGSNYVKRQRIKRVDHRSEYKQPFMLAKSVFTFLCCRKFYQRENYKIREEQQWGDAEEEKTSCVPHTQGKTKLTTDLSDIPLELIKFHIIDPLVSELWKSKITLRLLYRQQLSIYFDEELKNIEISNILESLSNRIMGRIQKKRTH